MNPIRDAAIRYSQGKISLQNLHLILYNESAKGLSKSNSLLMDRIESVLLEYTDGNQVDPKLKYAIKRATRK